jgi:hypothetical protein
MSIKGRFSFLDSCYLERGVVLNSNGRRNQGWGEKVDEERRRQTTDRKPKQRIVESVTRNQQAGKATQRDGELGNPRCRVCTRLIG